MVRARESQQSETARKRAVVVPGLRTVGPSQPLDVRAVLALQRSAGNAALARQLAPAAEERSRTAPVLYALDGAGRTYMSVAVPGHRAAEVAAYLYDTADAIERLRAANPGIGDFLPAGTRLHEGAGDVSHAAWRDFNDARRGGMLLMGEEPAAAGAGGTYRFSAAGRDFVLTEGQYQGMLRGSAKWLARKASFIVGRAHNGLEALAEHKGTNRFVRGLSDWMGGADLPDGERFRAARDLAQHIVDESKEPTAESVGRGVRLLELSASTLDAAEEEWRNYIEETVSGAEEMSHRLSIVRDTSFAVAAGLAGAAVAPAAFAAASAAGAGTATAAGTAIAAGAVTGSAAGGTLEFTGATAGEGVATAVTQGAEFDMGYVERRTEEGLVKGAIGGGLGAAGQLASPHVTAALTERLVGRGLPASLAQRLVVHGTSGALVGAPSGALGAALESAGALARGDISLREFAGRVWGGFLGGGAVGGVVGTLAGLRSPGKLPSDGEPVGDDDWTAINEELGLTSQTPRTNWTLPGTWKQVKPEAYRLIFGSQTLPSINRPGQVQMTLGHVVEKSTGGANALDNLMPQLNEVNVRLSGIYARKPFRLPASSGEASVVMSLNGKPIAGSLREAFESGVFDLAEQRAISNYLTSLVIAENPEFERRLAELVRQIPGLAEQLE
jgi:hypothetical protein